MSSAFIFNSSYFNHTRHKTALFTIFFLVLNAPAIAQNISNNRICRAYELELHKVGYSTTMSTRQVTRYHQLSQMLAQAKADAKRYSCNPGVFNSRSNSEECRYINTSQRRIETALNQISKQTSTPQQRRMKQAIYMDMSHYNCRNPQNLEWLMQENRHGLKPATRNRIKQTYKKPKVLRQASLPQPVALQTIPAATNPSDNMPVESSHSAVKPNFSILSEPKTNNAKAEDNTPPPAIEAVDYVPDSNVRRVGPVYLPAQ